MTQDERRQAVEDALRRVKDACWKYGPYCSDRCPMWRKDKETMEWHCMLVGSYADPTEAADILTRPEPERTVPITPIIERIRAYARRCVEQHITQPWFYEIESAEASVLWGEVSHSAPIVDWANCAVVDEWEKTIPGVIGKCDGVLVRVKKMPEPDWRDDVVRALRAVLPENWEVVKMEGGANVYAVIESPAVKVYNPNHDKVCWFHSDWREGCGKHAIMAVVAEYLDKHPREGV